MGFSSAQKGENPQIRDIKINLESQLKNENLIQAGTLQGSNGLKNLDLMELEKPKTKVSKSTQPVSKN